MGFQSASSLESASVESISYSQIVEARSHRDQTGLKVLAWLVSWLIKWFFFVVPLKRGGSPHAQDPGRRAGQKMKRD